MTNVFYTSDLHIGHALVARDRADRHAIAVGVPFDLSERDLHRICVEWHDAILAANWDAVVGPADHVWVLGDLCVGGTEVTAYALNWIANRPGIKHLVAGNHDPVHPMHRDAHRWQSAFLQVFASVQPFARRRIPFSGGRSMLLSHFPYRGGGDHTQLERFTQYRLPDEGEWLLHGHTHGDVRWASWRHPRQIHVGVDAWGLKPVSNESLTQLLTDLIEREEKLNGH